jgi:spore germination cell wall hydrolase CwlJ-like protein
MFNKIIAVVACILLATILYRAETRMDRIENRLNRLDEIVQTSEHVKYTARDVDCMTKNIYYEAGVEGRTGKYAVANVTVNRVKDGRWGDNVCKVVYAKKQFSWTLQKKLPKPDQELWAESRGIAIDVLKGKRVAGLQQSLYYHATYIKPPKWVDPKEHVLTVGQHKFYNNSI